MRKTIHLVLFGAVALWAVPVRAILPQDAQYREREIIQQRVRARAEYEQQQQDYEKALIASRIKLEASMKKAPWMRAGSNGVQGAADELPVLELDSSPQINHRFLVSAVLLILIGLIAGWVRHATREVDE